MDPSPFSLNSFNPPHHCDKEIVPPVLLFQSVSVFHVAHSSLVKQPEQVLLLLLSLFVCFLRREANRFPVLLRRLRVTPGQEGREVDFQARTSHFCDVEAQAQPSCRSPVGAGVAGLNCPGP